MLLYCCRTHRAVQFDAQRRKKEAVPLGTASLDSMENRARIDSCLRLLLVVDDLCDEVADDGCDHGVNSRDTPMHEVADERAADDACDGTPVDRAELHIVGHVAVTMTEEVHNDDDTNRGQGRVQDGQPVAEVVVQPDCEHDAQSASRKNHGALANLGDVGQTQRAGVQAVVVRRPDVGAENEDCRNHQTHLGHDEEDVVLAGESTCNAAEEEHQGVAEEERDDRRPDSGLDLGETNEVRCGRTAGDERTDDQCNAAEEREATGALCEDRRHAAAVDGRLDHGVAAEDRDQRNRDPRNDLKTLHAEVCGAGDADADDDDHQPEQTVAGVREEDLLHRVGEHGQANAAPADLGQRDHQRGQIGALRAECTVAEKVKVQTRLCADIAEHAAVCRKDCAADEDRQQESGEIQTVRQLNAGPHARGEESKAQHDDEHGPETFAVRFGNAFKGIVNVEMLFFHICFHEKSLPFKILVSFEFRRFIHLSIL